MGKIHGGNVVVRPAFPGTDHASSDSDTGSGLLLYIHVPFCRSRCHYCTFHSQAFNQVTFTWYLKTLLQEITLWGRRLKRPLLRTVYFGGGTPSLIPPHLLDRIMKQLRTSFAFQDDMEITLEANPDSASDISYYRALLSLGFNRLSLGMQSLNNDDLATMGRPHSAGQAIGAFETARKAGFGNIGVDLIWGLPGQRYQRWMELLKQVANLRPEHISAYNLTLEPETVMGRMYDAGELKLPSEADQGRMFIYGAEYLESRGYLHYEVSNFARIGFSSVHNSGYWDGLDYLGLGPSAVSTLGKRRFNNPRYMDEYDAYVRGELVGEEFELLSDRDRLKELVMLSLRTTRGLDLKKFKELADYDLVKSKARLISALHRENLVRIHLGRLKLTKNGMLVSNVIIRRLIFDD